LGSVAGKSNLEGIDLKNVPEMLRESAQTYEDRNKLYGDNYKRFGSMMNALFPKGLTITTPESWNQIGILVQIVSKISRYCENFAKGGHDDSLLDMAVYATMLRELDAFEKRIDEIISDAMKAAEKGKGDESSDL
jgi:hypothetical protein